MNCYGCGTAGHLERDCPNASFDTSGKPPWCGICDERTRLMGLDVAHRCPVCHPHRGKSLRQHRKCPHCHVTVYDWDNELCGRHAGPAVPDKRPDRETIDGLLEQARAAREPQATP